MPPSRKRKRRSSSPVSITEPRKTRSRAASKRATQSTRGNDDFELAFLDEEDEEDDNQTVIVIDSNERDVASQASNLLTSQISENAKPRVARKTASAHAVLTSPSSSKTRQTTLTFPKSTSTNSVTSLPQVTRSKSAQSVKKLVPLPESTLLSTERIKKDAASTYATSIDEELSDYDPIEDDDGSELTELVSRPASRLNSTSSKELSSVHVASQRAPIFKPVSRSQSVIHGTLNSFSSSEQLGLSTVMPMIPHGTSHPAQRTIEELWVEKYAPTDYASLALHKRKYEDVREWLTGVFAGRLKQRALVLAGPTGTSKTAALNVLSREMNFDITEWTNPSTPAISEPGEGSVTFSSMFSDFLSKAQQFGSTTSTTHSDHQHEEVFDLRSSALETRRKRIVLLEDIPNILTTSHSARKYFLDSIEAYLCSDMRSSPPIVFVVSEVEVRDDLNAGSASSFSAEHILGRDIMAHPRMARIQFNAVNKTLLSRVLRDIAAKEGLLSVKKNPASKATIKSADANRIIAELAELGDVRSAINALQWWATTGGVFLPTGRETYLAHFQALGKVLYNKPERVGEIPVEDAVLQAIPISPLVATLFENYPGSCADTEELVACSEALSDSEVLLSSQAFPRIYGRQFASEGIGEGMMLDSGTTGAHVAIRGLMCGLRRPVTRHNVSIKDFTSGKRQGRKSNSTFMSSSGFNGYALCKPLAYQLFRRQNDVLTDVARYCAITKLGFNDDVGGGAMSMSETAVMYMQCTAFWEALIRKDDRPRRIGGQYNGLSFDIDDDDFETPSKSKHDQFSQINDALLNDSISSLIISDDEIEDEFSD
ncbi:Rad17 cell cycle checkpoint protein-domain-containing protein [Lipomyces tetrasporus]|uniref:Rad17 cell cycle checkpoint protein-domain-containing protein n=1 Tax=Lipomyces tetrasporus TaxID=54092 RepID=A0AAD7QLN5_9ASCO|nr:Rad17 cell cycle checkpoint protein-domain-containing protein [Lipomyces tetrasporus]KAJ8097146.1 Rad17 cell cycle checkpoint protein-domain-containing protein [Lipomyces tetrasporus]